MLIEVAMSLNETDDLSETIDLAEWTSLDRIEEMISRIDELEADSALWEEERNRERSLRILAERQAAHYKEQADQAHYDNCELRFRLQMEQVALPCSCGWGTTETYCGRCGKKLQ